MMIVAIVWAKKNKYPVGKRSSLKEMFVKFIYALPSLLLLVIVIGGIIGGVFTATEASAVAVLYTVLLSFYYKELSFKDLPSVILESSQFLRQMRSSFAFLLFLSYSSITSKVSRCETRTRTPLSLL